MQTKSLRCAGSPVAGVIGNPPPAATIKREGNPQAVNRLREAAATSTSPATRSAPPALLHVLCGRRRKV